MAYDGRVLRIALQNYETDRARHEAELEERRSTIFARQPRLKEIDAELRRTMSRILSQALRRGTDPVPAIEALRDENMSLQEERRRLLSDMGLPEDALENKPLCGLCGDTGYRGGMMCRCLRDYYAREQKKELSKLLDVGNQSFETFSLEWYSEEDDSNVGISPRENMDWVCRTCKRFAENFDGESGNLLFCGAPGLGKTHLSAAIAREVADCGWSVVYDTANHIFERFEAQKFGRDDDAENDVNRVLHCDLLILDDLGTEMTTNFVQSALYQIVNTRLMERRSTLISTNLMVHEISNRYSEQIASRIEGEYRVLPFFGEDIRKLKRNR